MRIIHAVYPWQTVIKSIFSHLMFNILVENTSLMCSTNHCLCRGNFTHPTAGWSAFRCHLFIFQISWREHSHRLGLTGSTVDLCRAEKVCVCVGLQSIWHCFYLALPSQVCKHVFFSPLWAIVWLHPGQWNWVIESIEFGWCQIGKLKIRFLFLPPAPVAILPSGYFLPGSH